MTAVTIIMAAYNAGRTLESAAESVLGQTLQDLELIIVDDASRDDTLAVACTLAAKDSRVVVVAQTVNGGPAAARNAALAVARGQWVAVVDADDVILPARMESMLKEAQVHDADIVFDNLFYVEGYSERLYLPPRMAGALSLETYIESHRRACPIPNMGFLKPLIRRDIVQPYDEALKIGEDAMLIMALMAAGAKAWVANGAWYRYFRHAGSISARQGADSVRMINAAFRRFLKYRILEAEPLAAMHRLVNDNDRRILAMTLAGNIWQGHILQPIREIVKAPVMARFLWNEMCSQARYALKGAA